MRKLRTVVLLGVLNGLACGRGTPDVVQPTSFATDRPPETVVAMATTTTPPAVENLPFAFSADQTGKLLERALAPTTGSSLVADKPSAPKDRAPSAVDRAVLPLPTLPTSLPRPTPPVPLASQPRPLAEVPTLDNVPSEPQLPGRPELPVGGLSKSTGPDANTPIELPVYTKPVSDRAALDDPTRAYSVMAVLSPTPPARTLPAAFVRLSLPEPFEFLRGVLVQALSNEEPALPPVPRR